MQDLGVHGQHGATLPPGELEPSEHSREDQAGLAPAGHDNRRALSALCASASCAGDRQGGPRPVTASDGRSGSACTLASQLRSGVLPVPETVMAHRLLSAGQGAALLVAGSVAGARVAQLLTGVAMAPVPPVGGDGYGRG